MDMKSCKKWNFKEHKYYDCAIPDECSTYKDDMKSIVKCPNCGIEIEFGQCYTSIQYHTPQLGFGYAVCPSCYESELQQNLNFNS